MHNPGIQYYLGPALEEALSDYPFKLAFVTSELSESEDTRHLLSTLTLQSEERAITFNVNCQFRSAKAANKDKIMQDSTFQLGDKVKLKTGSPVMTLAAKVGQGFKCVWYNEDSSYFSEIVLKEVCLVKVGVVNEGSVVDALVKAREDEQAVTNAYYLAVISLGPYKFNEPDAQRMARGVYAYLNRRENRYNLPEEFKILSVKTKLAGSNSIVASILYHTGKGPASCIEREYICPKEEEAV